MVNLFMKLYHRTFWQAAKHIIITGFQTREDKKERVECGYGIYTVCSLEDANNKYNKQHYGNAIVEITIPDDLEWEHGTKVEFMRKTKGGDTRGNRQYPNCTNGQVAVLYDVNKILRLRISRDNGKTWYEREGDAIHPVESTL